MNKRPRKKQVCEGTNSESYSESSGAEEALKKKKKPQIPSSNSLRTLRLEGPDAPARKRPQQGPPSALWKLPSNPLAGFTNSMKLLRQAKEHSLKYGPRAHPS